MSESGVRGSGGPANSPSSTVTSPPTPPARRRSACIREKQNARCGTRRQSACTALPIRPPIAPRYSVQYSALQTSCQSTTIRNLAKGRTAAAASREKKGNEAVWATSYRRPRASRWTSTPRPNTSGGSTFRRPRGGVQRQPRPDRDHVDSGHVGGLVAVPLPESQVRDLMPVRGQALGEVAVPPLRATDGVRVEAVVDQADAHSRSGGSHNVRYALAGMCALLRTAHARSGAQPPISPATAFYRQ